MKVHTLTFIASSVSGACLLVSLACIACIYNDVHQIWLQLDQEIGAFRAQTDDLWGDLMALGANARRRARRAAEHGGAPKSSGSKPAAPPAGGAGGN